MHVHVSPNWKKSLKSSVNIDMHVLSEYKLIELTFKKSVQF